MKKNILVCWLQAFCAAACFQALPANAGAGVLVQCTNLNVIWAAPTNPWPKTLWVYQTQAAKPSPTVLSNLMALGSFTEKDIDPKRTGTNGIAFSKDGRALVISYPLGDISYGITTHYDPTHLAQDVPETNQLLQLTTNFLPKLGISLSELAKETNGLPKLYLPDNYFEYYVSNKTIVDIQRRDVDFTRIVDGIEYGGLIHGGFDSAIVFGEHSNVVGMVLHWPKLKQVKSYEAATPEKIIQWIHEGRAYYHLPMSFGSEIPIDWATVKSLAITDAQAFYYGGRSLSRQSAQADFPNYVKPYGSFTATVDTGTGNLNIIVNCPVIDETKSLETSR
jgi:hypothetical protein